jgi:hypothetical protein
MSLRSLPPNERRSATLAMLALAALLGLGLAATLGREGRVGPTQLAPPARSRLLAVLDGVMAPNVSPAERERFRAWVEAGATREGYASVAPIVSNNCASCHERGGQFPRLAAFEDLQPIALEAAPSGLGGLLTPRVFHFAIFPLLILVAVIGYLRRSGRPGWKALALAAFGAVVFDMAQFTWRQGRPEHLGVAWLAAAALGLAMAAITGLVWRELWAGKPRP